MLDYKAPRLRAGFEQLQETYPGLRGVRGDGNCYYRSVMYGLVEQVIASPDRHILFEQLAQRTEGLRGSYEGIYDEETTTLAEIFRQARDGQIWPTLQALEHDMRDPASRTDALLVRGARVFTAHQAEALYRESGFLEDNDVATILTHGEDAQGVAIQGSVLLDALGVRGSLVRVEMNQGPRQGSYQVQRSVPHQGDLDPPIEVNILLRPGHYDLLYSNEQYAAVQQFAAQPPAAAVGKEAPVEQMRHYKERVSPEQAVFTCLLRVMQDLEHKPGNVDASMALFLEAVDAHPEQALEQVLKAVDTLDNMKEVLVWVQGYAQDSPILERVQAQRDVLQEKVEALVNPAPGP